jgi:hypothetical protein
MSRTKVPVSKKWNSEAMTIAGAVREQARVLERPSHCYCGREATADNAEITSTRAGPQRVRDAIPPWHAARAVRGGEKSGAEAAFFGVIRMSRVRSALWSALALVVLTACAQPTSSSRQDVSPQPIGVEGRYVDEGSGMAFPESIGDFRRTALRRTAAGNGVSATYDFVPAEGGIVAAIEIAQAPAVAQEQRWAACAASYFAPQREVLRLHPDAKMLEEDSALPARGGLAPAVRAVFEYEEMFRGTRQLVQSKLLVYCFVGDRWMIRYNFSYAPAIDTASRISEFISAFEVKVAAR